jgi:hypothetical protein
MTHDHEDGFEAGCPECEMDEVAMQDTGLRWAARVIRHPSHANTRAYFQANPLPQQQDRSAS